MEKSTIRVKLKAIRKELDDYTVYVFQVLDKDEIELHKSKYIMCTKFPNWNSTSIDLDSIGYLQTMTVTAGEDTYYSNKTTTAYNYSFCQFMTFIPEVNKNTDKILIR